MAAFSSIALGIGAAAAVAGVGLSLYSMFQGGKDEGYDFQMPKAPEKPEQADAAKLAQEREMARRRAAARTQSVKTNPLGIEEEAQVVRKKLLGK